MHRNKQQAPTISKHTSIRIATYNCQGINEITKREAIKAWASERRLDVVVLTETKLKGQSKEGNEHTDYITYFASDPKDWTNTQQGIKAEQAGVGIMIRSSLAASVLDIAQHGSRFMTMKIKTSPPMRIIAAYLPQAFGASWEQKSAYYDTLDELLDACPRKEPVYIMGTLMQGYNTDRQTSSPT